MFNSLYKKCLNLSAHKNSKNFLALISFIESSFFPIPPDVMVIPMVIAKKRDFIKIFIIATIFSVLGGVLGYFIGAFFFDIGTQVMTFYGYENKLSNIKNSLINISEVYLTYIDEEYKCDTFFPELGNDFTLKSYNELSDKVVSYIYEKLK